MQLLNFSESVAFVGVALFLGEISFLILLSLAWRSDIFSPKPKKMYFYIPDWLTNHISFLILQLLFYPSVNQMHMSTSVGRVSLSCIKPQ